MSKFAFIAGAMVLTAGAVFVARKVMNCNDDSTTAAPTPTPTPTQPNKAAQQPTEQTAAPSVPPTTTSTAYIQRWSLFQTVFAKSTQVPFDADWHNGTGYFDGANRSEAARGLQVGQCVGFVADDGRKGLIIRIAEGNKGCYTAFERFTNPSETRIATCGHATTEYSDDIWETLTNLSN